MNVRYIGILLPIMPVDYVRTSHFVESSEPSVLETGGSLAASITKAASKQTYYTIRFLTDRGRAENAYQAYAYFRWVDDWVDRADSPRDETLAFLERQQDLVECCYHREPVSDLLPQEAMLVELIRSDCEENSGLQAYIRNMMAVMTFDAHRRGRVISQQELDDYSHHLAVAVTEALHYFIGHDDHAPKTEARYYAVTGAHVIHMLRDSFEDVAAGYFNIPCEFLKFFKLDHCDTQSMAFRVWVHNRVQLARNYFAAGKDYLAQVENRRCRLAGSAYIARFESILNAIEADDYYLRSQYLDRKTIKGALNITRSAVGLYFASTGRIKR